MPRYSRESLQTTFYHIMTQGINRSYIFEKPKDIKYYIESMKELENDINIKIIAYCIMNNHAHILLNVRNVENLSIFMRRLNTKFAMYYNKKYQRVGYVFRNRFKSEGIYSEKQLYNCMRYIYNNPVKAKICKFPEEYKYSNYFEGKFSYEKYSYQNYNFIDIEINEDEIIDDYIAEKNIDIDVLIKDKEKLKKLVCFLKKDKGISYRKIERKINISRETLRKICK